MLTSSANVDVTLILITKLFSIEEPDQTAVSTRGSHSTILMSVARPNDGPRSSLKKSIETAAVANVTGNCHFQHSTNVVKPTTHSYTVSKKTHQL